MGISPVLNSRRSGAAASGVMGGGENLGGETFLGKGWRVGKAWRQTLTKETDQLCAP